MAVVARECAKNLIHQHLNQHGCFERCIAICIEEACAEAVTEDRKIWDAQHASDLKIQCAQAFLDGQAVMKERAAKMVHEYVFEEAWMVEKEIRALPLEERK